MALSYQIPLIFYGENEAEYGNPLADNNTSLRNRAYHVMNNMDDVHIAGVSLNDLINEYGLTMTDIMPYLPPIRG